MKNGAQGTHFSHTSGFVASTCALFPAWSVSPQSQGCSELCWLQLSKADVQQALQQALQAATCPSHSSLTCVLHRSLILLPTTLRCISVSAMLLVPLIPQAHTPGPFQSHLTCQGSLSADYGGNVAASLGQVSLFSYICCH